MNRDRARLVAWALFALFLIFPGLARVLGVPELVWPGIAALIGMVAVELIFDRCPHCRARLSWSHGRFCPRCGKSLKEEP